MSDLVPINLSKTDWYYAEKTHLLLIHQVRDGLTGAYLRTDQIKIPWRKIEASLKQVKAKKLPSTPREGER